MNRPRTQSTQILVFSPGNQLPSHFCGGLENEGYLVQKAGCIEEVLFYGRKLAPHCLIVDLIGNQEASARLLTIAQKETMFSRTCLVLLTQTESNDYSKIQIADLPPAVILAQAAGVPYFLTAIKRCLKGRAPAAVTFSRGKLPVMALRLQGEVSSIAEGEFSLILPVRIVADSLVKIDSNLLQRQGLSECIFKRTKRVSSNGPNQRYINEISIIGINPTSAHITGPLIGRP